MTKFVIFIGIDISKQWFDAVLYWSGLQRPFPTNRFDNNQLGFQRFLLWSKQQLARHQIKGSWFVCMEHTGIYSLPLALFLEGNNIKVVAESPLRISRSRGLQRAKTDPIDAADIALYAFEKHLRIKVRPLPNPLLLQVQTLLSLRYRLTRYKQGLDTAARELHGFVDPLICTSVADYSNAVCTNMQQQLKSIDRQIKQLLFRDPELKRLYKLVHSVVGIGDVITAYLIVYTNAFTAFEKSRQFSAFIGVAPFPNRSGSSVNLPDKVSPWANKRLKALISTAATVAVIHDPQIKAFYLRKKNEGKADGWIFNAIKNKIINRVFAVVKRGAPYVKLDAHLN